MKNIKQILIVISLLIIGRTDISTAQEGWPHWGMSPKINYITIARAKTLLKEPWVNVDPDNKQQVLDSLQSPNPLVRHYVIYYCGYAQIREALPTFKTLFSQHPEIFDPKFRTLSERLTILNAVTLMEDTTFQQEFRIEIDSLRNYPKENSQMSFLAGYLMDKHNDDYGFNTILPYYTNPDSVNKYGPNSSYLILFKDKHREEVIEALKVCVNNHPNDYERAGTLWDLNDLGYSQIEAMAHNLAESDTSEYVREEARLIINKVNRSLFKRITNHQMDATSLIQIDTLKSNITQMLSASWIGDNSFVVELNNILDQARSFLLTGDSIKCARHVQLFQSRVNEEYRDSLDNDNKFVTVFGWKFLYGKARWLLYCLPQISPDPEMESIFPTYVYAGSNAFSLTVNGKNFISGSTVNWGGVAKPTTYIADSILQASILVSDIAVVDSPLVTVKNPDNSESNGIRFYVLRQSTVLELIDSLRAKLQQCYEQNQIGDKNFVKELDNGLENAKKHLIKGDSVNCAKEIDKFQNKIKKEYEKKPRSKDKRFVTEEGYRVLYNSAQAILDRLPGKK